MLSPFLFIWFTVKGSNMSRIKMSVEVGKVTDGEIQDGVIFKVGDNECIWPFLELERAYIENAKLRLTDVPPLRRNPWGPCQHNTALRLDGSLVMWCASCGALYTRTKNGWAWMQPSRFVLSKEVAMALRGETPEGFKLNAPNPDSMLGDES